MEPAFASVIIRNQLDDLMAESDPKWNCKETLAILPTYGQSEEFSCLCIPLGDRLEAAGDDESASNRYMCALHLDGAVRYWKRQVQESRANSKSLVDDYNALHEFCCKVSVLREATGPTKSLPPDVVTLFNQYAQALAHQGLYATVAKYSMDDPTDRQSQILRDRLYWSRASQRLLPWGLLLQRFHTPWWWSS